MLVFVFFHHCEYFAKKPEPSFKPFFCFKDPVYKCVHWIQFTPKLCLWIWCDFRGAACADRCDYELHGERCSAAGDSREVARDGVGERGTARTVQQSPGQTHTCRTGEGRPTQCTHWVEVSSEGLIVFHSSWDFGRDRLKNQLKRSSLASI